MDANKGKMTLISQGSNSEIYRYGSADKAVVLKVVKTSAKKEVRHLEN